MGLLSPLYSAVLMGILFHVSLCLTDDDKNKASLNIQHSYPVHIGAVNHIVQGHVSSEAEVGTLIPSNVVVEGEEQADFTVHLRVEVRASNYTRPHMFHPDIKVNTSDPANPRFVYPVIKFPNSSLPYGMEFVVVHTNAFAVNDDRYIVVNDLESLHGQKRVLFDVILKDKLTQTHYVSNQLPFIVEVEYPESSPNPNAALFAGVLILTIIAISLIIPFVVRAKRRVKAGKPICGCGSADDGSDSGSTDSYVQIEKHRPRSMSMQGKDNLAMILDNGRMRTHRPSVDQHTTIQNHALRSTSSMLFQPHYLDPHYRDVYDRPTGF